ncbi:helix-turn-helix domain-containing protein [Geomicrobium sp. JCM 19055]|uniref:helix-turn-helix domain-containing protein n=1 Tax=Geomicrobium sp. JCM 19055 TaxID=1460649 RepID=UPI00045ED40A|nr:helix-turn-helix domain-containing protein [Geomicrobium sp. JCM 19055]GAK00566.1 transcriptional regulator [Geomicrobium sp. JCM 19055]
MFLPALRKRLDDIDDLVTSYTERNYPHFLNEITESLDQIVQTLSTHSWHGNIRELENTLERMFAYLENPEKATKLEIVKQITEAIKENNILLSNEGLNSDPLHHVIKEMEYKQIKEVLAETNGNKQEAAKILGMSRSTLWRKLQKSEQQK